MASHLQYPVANIQPPTANGPQKLWVLQGFNSPTTPGGALNGISTDFAPRIAIPKTPSGAKTPSGGKTPSGLKTPKGVNVPSREGNLTELGYPNWVSIFDGLCRKITDEHHYGNYLGLNSSADGSGEQNARAALDILQACIGQHLPAWKAFLNNNLRAAPSTLPASPNPASITAPIPPLTQQMLLIQLSAFLSQSLLSHQLQQLLTVMLGQTHYVLGEVMKGVGFPVETHVLGRSISGGGCGIRLLESAFQARVYLFRACAAQVAGLSRSRNPSSPPPQPIFYLSPSHAHGLGFPETLPRFCWELGLPASAFKVLPLTPSPDEALLSQIAHLLGKLDPAQDARRATDATGIEAHDMPNPFLSYQLDARSLEQEILKDLEHARSHPGAPMPAAVFATVGNIAGLDLPYEYDHVEELARITTKYALSLHAEGTSLFAEDPHVVAATTMGSSNNLAGQAPSGASSSSGTPNSMQRVTSSLFASVDSILIRPGPWLGLPSGLTLLALRDPHFLPSGIQKDAEANGFWAWGVEQPQQEGGACLISTAGVTTDEFASLFALWFNLLQVNSASFSSLLARLHAKQCDKIQSLKRMISAQSWPSFVAPSGELDEERTAYLRQLSVNNLQQWLPPAPSHTHLFFYLGLPQPYSPGMFNFTSVGELNEYMSNRISQRISSKQGDYLQWSRVFGLHLLPVHHFSRVGFMYQPAPVSIWTTENQIGDEIAAFAKVLVEVLSEELSTIEANGRLREEFKELIEAEAPEFVYVPAEMIEHHVQSADGRMISTGTIGLGGVRFLPAQVPEHHSAEIGALLNSELEKLQSSMHLVTAPAPPSLTSTATQQTQMVSMYRGGRTTDGGLVCTVLDLSELVVRKGIRELLSELKSTASKLVYPSHIVDDLNETLKSGIRAAEERLVTKSVDAYRPTNMLRWIPVVGSVLNWVAPAVPENGQQFDMKKRELSSIKYSYSNASEKGTGTPGMSRKGSSANLQTTSTTPISSGTPSFASPSPLSTNHLTTPNSHQTPVSGTNSSVVAASAVASAVPILSAVQQRPVPPQSNLSPLPPLGAAAVAQSRSPQSAAALAQSQLVSSLATGRPPVAPQAHVQPAAAHPVQPVVPVATINQQAPPSLAGVVQPPQQPIFNTQQPPQQPQQAPVAAAPVAPSVPVSVPLSPSALPRQHRSLPPVHVTLDEADSSFVADLNSASGTRLNREQLQMMTEGESFLAYFPNQPEDETDAAAAAAAAAQTSVTKLFLFLSPSYRPNDEEALELGVAPNEPVSLLCWCEPGQRYVKPDQAVAVAQVSALHLGAGESFPRQSVRANCFSLITQHVALHLEAEKTEKRKVWFLALYTLVSQGHSAAPTQSLAPAAVPGLAHQQQQQSTQLQHAHPGTGTVSPSSALTPQQISTPQPMSDAEEERQLAAAKAFLERGSNFVVYVLDKHDIDLTTRHEVILWFRPPVPGTNIPHSLCWCRRGGALDYSPSRSLPLNRTVQICMGKQTKAFRNAAAADSDPASAFSVMVEKMILNVTAASPEARAEWLSCFHTVMSAAGKKRVFDEAAQAQQASTNPQ